MAKKIKRLKKAKCHPAIKRAGLADDPVFGRRLSLKGMLPSTVVWIKSRYRKTCEGCGKRSYTSPSTLPVCRDCWMVLPHDVRVWWWKSRKTQRSLEYILDDHFEGGYEVEPDYNQVALS